MVNFGPDHNRIGVVVYGNDAILEITLDQFDNVDDFKAAVANIAYMVRSLFPDIAPLITLLEDIGNPLAETAVCL